MAEKRDLPWNDAACMHARMNKTVCPKCGAELRLTLSVESEGSTVDVSKREVLDRFTKDVRDHLEVEIGGNFAKVRLKGKYNRGRFNKANIEVKGYGGTYVKGYFSLPLAGVMEEKNH